MSMKYSKLVALCDGLSASVVETGGKVLKLVIDEDQALFTFDLQNGSPLTGGIVEIIQRTVEKEFSNDIEKLTMYVRACGMRTTGTARFDLSSGAFTSTVDKPIEEVKPESVLADEAVAVGSVDHRSGYYRFIGDSLNVIRLIYINNKIHVSHPMMKNDIVFDDSSNPNFRDGLVVISDDKIGFDLIRYFKKYKFFYRRTVVFKANDFLLVDHWDGSDFVKVRESLDITQQGTDDAIAGWFTPVMVDGILQQRFIPLIVNERLSKASYDWNLSFQRAQHAELVTYADYHNYFVKHRWHTDRAGNLYAAWLSSSGDVGYSLAADQATEKTMPLDEWFSYVATKSGFIRRFT